MEPRLILFDIDGTLLLTGGAGKPALEKAFEDRFAVTDSWGDLRPHGKTDPLILQEMADYALQKTLNAEDIQFLTERYHHYFEAEIEKAPRFRLMPGICDLLKSLSRRTHCFLGIATGNFEHAAFLKLKRGDIHHYFSFGGFGSDSADRFELTLLAYKRGESACGGPVIPERVYVIGDTPYDIQAGKQLGATTLAVTTGGANEAELARYQPDFLVKDLRDTEEILEILDGD